MSLDILLKHFALLACWSTRLNLNGSLMVLMHHLNAGPGVVGGRKPASGACTESESQMSEESVEGRNYYTGVEYQMLKSLSQILECD